MDETANDNRVTAVTIKRQMDDYLYTTTMTNERIFWYGNGQSNGTIAAIAQT